MYQAHPRTQPLYSQVMGYESEESDPWTQAVGAYTAEKTLTVEMPQGHSHFTKTRAPKQKFQLNKITFSHEKTVPVTPISPPVAMKRKASQDTFSLTTGKQLRLGGRMKTLKPVRPVTAPQITAHVIKRTKPVKPAPTPVLPDEVGGVYKTTNVLIMSQSSVAGRKYLLCCDVLLRLLHG